MQVEHADLVILSAVADHFAATGEENEVIGAVPLLDDVQTFVDLPAECLAVKVFGTGRWSSRPCQAPRRPCRSDVECCSSRSGAGSIRSRLCQDGRPSRI
jgi:hypothetical protein